MKNIFRFQQVLKLYEQKDDALRSIIKTFNNHIISDELNKYYGFSNYPFGDYKEEENNKIHNKWSRFKPKHNEEIPLIKIGEFKNNKLKGIPVLLPIITQDNEIKINRNIIFRDCKKVNKFFKNIIIRLLTSIYSQQIKLHLFDNVRKGHNLIDFTTLSNVIIGNGILYKEDLIFKEIQNIHDKVINLYHSISNKYNTLDEYNENESKIKEPYHFLFICDFPKGFNKNSLELLKDIMNYGNKVGFEVIIDLNLKYATEIGLEDDFFSNLGFIIDYYNRFDEDIYKFTNFDELSDYWFDLEEFELNKNIIQDIITSINDYLHNKSNKQIYFSKIIQENMSHQNNNQSINVPIGYANEYSKTLNFDLSEVYHCLIGGSTGSGKTVLLHTLINSLAYHYSPDEISLYLLDYKEGTEFKIYENLSHCKLLSIASDVVFGISVLEKILMEIEDRGSEFKNYEVSSLQMYREISKNSLPRIVIIIDEFQVLLIKDNKNKEKAKQYIDDIVRRGRSFGIHLILSTQTLQGVELLSSTKSNIGLRIALRMNPSDATNILSDKNQDKPITLSLGEAIYNNSYGHISADIKFQVAYITNSQIKENIIKVNSLYKNQNKPTVYNGDKDSNPYENKSFIDNNVNNKIYVGEANFLSNDHKYFTLEEQYGENILICGSNIDDAIKIYLSILHSFKLFEEIDIYNFNFLNKSNQYKSIFEENNLYNNKIDDLEKTISDIYEKFIKRKNEEIEKPNTIILGIFNLQNAVKLLSNGSERFGNYDEKNDLARKFSKILEEGSIYKIHVLIFSSMLAHLNNFHIKPILFSSKIIVNGGDGYKLIGQTIQIPNLKNGTALISCNTNEEEFENIRLYSLDSLKGVIKNAKQKSNNR